MSLLAEDPIQVRNYITKSHSDTHKEIAEVTKGLETIFHSGCCADIPQEEMIDSLTRISQMKSEEVEDLLKKIKLINILQNHVDNAKTRLRYKLSYEVNQTLEKVETSLKKIESEFILFLPLLAIQAKVQNESRWLENLNIALLELLHLVESRFPVESLSLFKIVKEILENLASETVNNWKPSYEFQKTIIPDYAIQIGIVARAILWEINNDNRKFNIKLKTVDELFEDWEKTYSEDEVTKSLEIFEKGIDEERIKRGGRTIFS
ncbi:hypothetical protein WA1_48000 [Scytonema hofmannii PCC 7110]|uniref:Uncharacterized protein n=1 Tax=Scytonema hofmannii PCC 7110 TaxID=128403 RepID=A0A139WY47_9CYAN|nr:hypothetical protein [Scytonema hofmannii]KYC37356.1 hypothetical protein WA1_48000 [Scytonema hofmannii PCC 7110]